MKPLTRGRAAMLAVLALTLAACGTAPVVKSTASATPPPAPSASITPQPAIPSPLPDPARTAGDLATRIDAFIDQPRFRHAAWGIAVTDLASGRSVYRHRAEEFFVPASNAKLYTAALALATFGADARFQTTLWTTARTRANGVLGGDLILYGGGDPSLGDGAVTPATTGWADHFAAGLASLGITRVDGDIIADATHFQGSPWGSGWEADDLATWYAPPASALSNGANVIAFTIRRDGARCCRISTDPAWAPVTVLNLTTQTPDAPLSIGRAPGATTFDATGQLAAGQQQRRVVLAAPDPALLAAHALAAALSDHGITVHGRIRAVHWPQASVVTAATRRLAGISSPPLRELLRHMLKASDNLYAQVLLQDVGVVTAGTGVCADRATTPRSSEAWGLCALRALLARIGIADQTSFSEGSGLSRHDLVTPHATARLLAWVRQQPFAADFIAALPVAGVDGTLRRRLVDTAAAGNLRAKTGTLSHVYALSGYVTDAAGAPLAFALYLNRYLRPRDALGRSIAPSPRADLDAIAALLAAHGAAPAAAASTAP